MTHFSVRQYTEARRRFLRIAQLAKTKGLYASFEVNLYAQGTQSYDAAYIRVYDSEDSLYFRVVSAVSDREDDAYNREHCYKYVGLLAAFDEAEAKINNYPNENN